MLETRDQIIDLADDLIRRKGFNAFSYRDISVPLDIRNAAIHYYFPTKTQLGEAVIDAELQRIAAYRRECGHLPGEEQLKWLICSFHQKNKSHLLCLMGSLTPDYDTFGDPLRQKVKEMCTMLGDWLATVLEKARASGRLRFKGTAADRALLVISSLLSSLLLSRVQGEAVFERMQDQLLRDLGAGWRIADLPGLSVSQGLGSMAADKFKF